MSNPIASRKIMLVTLAARTANSFNYRYTFEQDSSYLRVLFASQNPPGSVNPTTPIVETEARWVIVQLGKEVLTTTHLSF